LIGGRSGITINVDVRKVGLYMLVVKTLSMVSK